MSQAVKDGLIVALDIESADDAFAIFEDMRISVGLNADRAPQLEVIVGLPLYG